MKVRLLFANHHKVLHEKQPAFHLSASEFRCWFEIPAARIISSLIFPDMRTLFILSSNMFIYLCIIGKSLDWNRISKDSQASINPLEIHPSQECSLWNSLHFYVDLKNSTPKSQEIFSKYFFYCSFDFRKPFGIHMKSQ